MTVFIYDKSFEGLLSAVFDAFTLKRFPLELYGQEDILPLTAQDPHLVLPVPEKSERVFRALSKKLSIRALRSLLYAWLSEQPGSDLIIFRFICEVFKTKRSIEADLAKPELLQLMNLERKVSRESVRIAGFARFQKSCEGSYFAAVAPKYNVLPLVLGHFAERLHDQCWILYDLNRSYGFLHKNGAFEEVFIDEKRLDGGFLREEFLAEGEMLLEKLWRVYFDNIAIKERTNQRLQRSFMPKRFWPYLTEKRAQATREQTAYTK